jgi:hypothetical protein
MRLLRRSLCPFAQSKRLIPHPARSRQLYGGRSAHCLSKNQVGSPLPYSPKSANNSPSPSAQRGAVGGEGRGEVGLPASPSANSIDQRYNFPYDKDWQGRHYLIKQVVPVIKEKTNEIVVITVYTSDF